ncbi:portal protein [Inquilinus limosus]|uniref:portal protein n=1 Tax=Inquilinus limosus TaxID=171674 RepID=UPI00247FD301|nr:portal protein [Inquilinus limosus]
MNPETIAGRYGTLEADRLPFLERAYTCAELTIPSLLPRAGTTAGATLYEPWQSVGARGVNHLANRFHTVVLPANAPFFRLKPDMGRVERMTPDERAKAEVEKALSVLEQRVKDNIEGAEVRGTALEAMKHLLVAGNFLCYAPPEGGLKGFRLDRYVVRRDDMGNLLELIVKETVAPEVVPPEIRKAAPVMPLSSAKPKAGKTEQLDLYTRVWRNGNHYRVEQEVNGHIIESSRGSYPLDALPWFPLRLVKVDGEDYSRSHVEEYLGDLRSLENLSKAIVEGVAALAKLIILVNPSGVTTVKTIKDAKNGDVRSGRADDVSMVQADGKAVDFRVAKELAGEIENRLAYAFLLNSAIQRSGERVTAEEIRFMAGELEQAQGGAYSMLATEFQLPLVNVVIRRMKSKGDFPRLPKGLVKPLIVTGLDALGRSADFIRLNEFLDFAAKVVPPDQLPLYLNVPDALNRGAAGIGIDTGGLINTQEQIQAAMQQQQLQEAAQAAVPGAMQIARDQMAPDATAPQ